MTGTLGGRLCLPRTHTVGRALEVEFTLCYGLLTLCSPQIVRKTTLPYSRKTTPLQKINPHGMYNPIRGLCVLCIHIGGIMNTNTSNTVTSNLPMLYQQHLPMLLPQPQGYSDALLLKLTQSLGLKTAYSVASRLSATR